MGFNIKTLSVAQKTQNTVQRETKVFQNNLKYFFLWQHLLNLFSFSVHLKVFQSCDGAKKTSGKFH